MAKIKFLPDTSIAFVGLVRPIVGSLVTIAEIQARFVAKIYSLCHWWKGERRQSRKTSYYYSGVINISKIHHSEFKV